MAGKRAKAASRARKHGEAAHSASREMLAMPRLLPWQEPIKEQLQLAWRAGRLPHALLVQGAEGVGKRCFGAWLAQAVLCDAATEHVRSMAIASSGLAQADAAGRGHDARQVELAGCGHCASCTLIHAGSHPDLCWIAPEEDKQQISVDQVRMAIERLAKTSYRQGYKVVVIEPAHQMTVAAASSLLKTLEEPSSGSMLILLTSRAFSLLPTVRSRCQKIMIPRPCNAQALAWLQEHSEGEVDPALLEFAGGAPLLALRYAQEFEDLGLQMQATLHELFAGHSDLSQIASTWAAKALPERLIWLDLWLMSVSRGLLAGSAERITFPGRPVHLPSPPHTLNISAVYALVDRLRELRGQLSHKALVRELAVESWLIGLSDVLGDALRRSGAERPAARPSR